MALETVNHINDLDINNPPGTDPKSQGDDHLRNIKKALKADLPMTQAAGAKGLALLYTATAQSARDLLGVNTFSKRNRVINGNFEIDQRNTGASKTITAGAALSYVTDRFFVYCTGADVSAQQINNFSLTGKLLSIGGGSAGQTGVGIGTRLDQILVRDLNGQNCTLSVKLQTFSSKVVSWYIYEANTLNSFGSIASPTKTLRASGTFSSTSTETLFSANFLMSSSLNGIEILFTIPSLPNSSDYLNISNLQLEARTIANSDIIFDDVDYTTNLLKCQRYYAKTTCTARGNCTAINQAVDTPIYFPVQMRVAPAATYITGTGATANATTISVFGIGTQSARFSITSLAAGDTYAVDREYSFDAEL